MIFIPTEFLKPGMLVARSISGENGTLYLLTQGQRLTARLIERLEESHIGGVYIESAMGQDIQPVMLIEPERKQKMVKSLKKVLKNNRPGAKISSQQFQETKQMAVDLVNRIIESDEVLLDVVRIQEYDDYTCVHSVNVSILAVLLGIQLHYTAQQLEELSFCGLMHDLGKVDISVDIINKTGNLGPQEWDEIKKHPVHSVERLENNSNMNQRVRSGILLHHEHYDGSGYPRGLKGDEIYIYGRILALADVYDALTSERPYRQAWSSAQALEYMVAQSGTHFDPELLQKFLRTVAAYPAGSVVYLSDGSVALVMRNTPDNALRPIVRVIQDTNKRPCSQVVNLNTDPAYKDVAVQSSIHPGDSELPLDLFAPPT